MQQLPLGFEPVRAFSSRDYVVSAPNLEAWTWLRDWPSASGGAAALIGPPASGKSHLAQIWSVAAGANAADLKGQAHLPPRGRYLVEDVDAGFDDAALFHLINLAQQPGGGLLLTAKSPPARWPARLPDLKSRLNALPVLRLGEPDDAILEGMLLKAFRARRIRPSQELLDYLLRRIERSAPAAEAAAERLDREASAARVPVGRALAVKLFGEDDPFA